jgi:hypothetical protein
MGKVEMQQATVSLKLQRKTGSSAVQKGGLAELRLTYQH